MADNKAAGPPTLENPNSPDNVCVTCQNRVDSLCPACQELALLRTNSTTNEPNNSDSNTPQAMSDSDMTDSAHYADTIIDSPNSRSSSLQLNVSDISTDENNVSDYTLNDEEVEVIKDPAPLMPRRRPIRNRLTVLFGECARGTTFKPLSVGNRCDLVSNAVSNDPDNSDFSDMPPLEGYDEDDCDF